MNKYAIHWYSLKRLERGRWIFGCYMIGKNFSDALKKAKKIHPEVNDINYYFKNS